MPRRNKKNKKNPPPPPPSPKDSCKYCQKSHLKLSKCSRCKEAFYCSADCQKKDWVNHKETCKPQTSEQHSPEPPLPPNEEESCKNCGISGVKLSLCARCQETKYCSRECQRENWKEHKVDCHSAPSPQAFQDKCRVCFNSCGKAGYCDNCIGIKNFGKTFPLKVPLDVYRRARERYRGFQLVTDFKDIEPIHHPITCEPNNQVLLALLYGPGGHPARPCMDMRDEKGKVYMLIFYLDNDDKPNRDFLQKFIPGNYVCIPYPYIHHFLSGFDGFRIDTTDGADFIESVVTKLPATTYAPTNVPDMYLLNICLQ